MTSRILIVEDESYIALQVRAILLEEGYAVTEIAATGSTAVECALRERPDLILMDIVLADGTNGIDAAREILQHMDVPVIYLTGYATPEMIERARTTAPYGYLNKPVGRRDLLTNIDSALYRHGAERRIRESEEHIRRLNDEIIRAQEAERARIASDLHDSVVQTLLAAKLNFGETRNGAGTERFDLGLQFIDRAVEELREIYTDLYPAILRDLGLDAAIRWHAKKHLEPNGIGAELDLVVDAVMPDEVKTHLYRIVQEMISNVVRHSGADHVTVKMVYHSPDNFLLSLTDNGMGLDRSKAAGYGLHSIEQRAAILGCRCDMTGTPGVGTTITLQRCDT